MLHFRLNERIYNSLFNYAIRDKFDSIKTLINTYDYLINYTSIISEQNSFYLEIFIKNIDGYRLFFLEKDRIFTICSPFRINKINNNIVITHNLIGEINNMEISLLKRIFDDENIYMISDAMNSYCLLEEIINEDFSNSDFNTQIIWELLIYLLNYESGYVRYDYDPNNGSSEELHPLHHLDISYNSYSTYKFGLHKRILIDEFIDIFDANTNQLFLKKLN